MVLQQVEQHRILGAVVVVHQRLGDAAGFRDHGDRCAGVAVLREQGRRAAENALPFPVVVVRPRARHRVTLALTVQLVNYYPAVGSHAKTTYVRTMPHPLVRIVDQLRREPSRTGSIVVTVFGDAIMPRGGSVWLGTLLEFFKTLDIDGGVVRTAMSRLAADGWIERNKVGRNSFYRLAQNGRQTFDIAAKHIYGAPVSDWTGRFELLLIGNGSDRDAAREALKNAGFGSPLPGVWVAPSGVPIPEEAAS